MSQDTIVLTDKEEIEDLLGNEISDKQWEGIKQKLARNKHMWQAIDEAIGEVVESL